MGSKFKTNKGKPTTRAGAVVDIKLARQRRAEREDNERTEELLRLFRELPPDVQDDFLLYVEVLAARHGKRGNNSD